MADSTCSRWKRPSAMTLDEYIIFRMRYKKLHTVTDRDRQMGCLAPMIIAVLSDDSDMQLEASSLFRNILQIEPNPPFQQVVDAGIVPCFVQFLNRQDLPQLQMEAAYILTLFAESSEHTNVVVDHDVVPVLVTLLHAPNGIFRTIVISVLGNIAASSPEHRKLILQNMAWEPLLAHFKEDDSVPRLKVAASALYKLCKGNPPSNFEMSSHVLPFLQQLLHSSNQEVISDACRTLLSLSHGIIGHGKAHIMSDICSELVELLRHPSPSVILSALETLATIVSGDEIPHQVIEHITKLEALFQLGILLVGKYDKDIKKVACQIVMNITRNNCNHTQEVVCEGVIYALQLLYINSLEEEVEIKMEVARAISNVISHGTPQDVKNVSDDCIEPMCEMLDCSDKALVLNCLRALDRILDLWQQEKMNNRKSFSVDKYVQLIQETKGLRKILKLRNDGKDLVSGIAESILLTYWPGLV